MIIYYDYFIMIRVSSSYYCLYSKDTLSVSKIVSQANRIVYLMHILQKSAGIFQMDSGC